MVHKRKYLPAPWWAKILMAVPFAIVPGITVGLYLRGVRSPEFFCCLAPLAILTILTLVVFYNEGLFD